MNLSMRNTIVLFIFLFLSIWVKSQDSLIQICSDPLGYQYYVYPNKIEKRDAQLNLLFTNGAYRYGAIQSLDITNPLTPFVYFQLSNQIIYLDNTLSDQGNSIDLYNTIDNGTLYYFTVICGSRNGGLWAFDNAQKKLVRLNNSGNKIFEISNLPSFQQMASWDIHWMKESGQKLFLRDEKYLHVFDFTGAYLESQLFPYWPCDVYQEMVWECRDQKLWRIYPLETPVTSIPRLHPPFSIQNNRCYQPDIYPNGWDIQEFVNK